MKVSLCVPSFERPDTLRTLVRSFLAQDYAEAELCISDDSRTDDVERVVTAYGDARVVYQRNRSALGFGANLRACIAMSTGDVVVIMGDDDMLASPRSLALYAEAFAREPMAGYARSSLVQIDGSGSVTLAYGAREGVRKYEPGQEALGELLLSSVHITGIAFRRVSAGVDLLERYPTEPMLFPQVALCASVLAETAGLSLGSYLVAARMHGEQLGFAAMRKPRHLPSGRGERAMLKLASSVRKADFPEDVAAEGAHGNVEIMKIIDGAKRRQWVTGEVAVQLERSYVMRWVTNMANEKMNVGNLAVLKHLRVLRSNSGYARKAWWLPPVCALLVATPNPVVACLKTAVRRVVAQRVLAACLPERDWPLVQSAFHGAFAR